MQAGQCGARFHVRNHCSFLPLNTEFWYSLPSRHVTLISAAYNLSKTVDSAIWWPFFDDRRLEWICNRNVVRNLTDWKWQCIIWIVQILKKDLYKLWAICFWITIFFLSWSRPRKPIGEFKVDEPAGSNPSIQMIKFFPRYTFLEPNCHRNWNCFQLPKRSLKLRRCPANA
jgi:hypothetical protein